MEVCGTKRNQKVKTAMDLYRTPPRTGHRIEDLYYQRNINRAESKARVLQAFLNRGRNSWDGCLNVYPVHRDILSCHHSHPIELQLYGMGRDERYGRFQIAVIRIAIL